MSEQNHRFKGHLRSTQKEMQSVYSEYKIYCKTIQKHTHTQNHSESTRITTRKTSLYPACNGITRQTRFLGWKATQKTSPLNVSCRIQGDPAESINSNIHTTLAREVIRLDPAWKPWQILVNNSYPPSRPLEPPSLPASHPSLGDRTGKEAESTYSSRPFRLGVGGRLTYLYRGNFKLLEIPRTDRN